MFKMRNKLGNAIVIAKTEQRRDALIRLGFNEIEDASIKGDNISKFEQGFIDGLRSSTFSKMKTIELKALAAERGIDISTASNKAEIIKILSESM